MDKIYEELNAINERRKTLKLERNKEINKAWEEMKDSLPSAKICDIESKKMAQQVLNFSDYNMESEKIKIIGSTVVAVQCDYGYFAGIRIKKIVYHQASTYDVDVDESSDGYRGAGSYSATSYAYDEVAEIWGHISQNFPKFHKIAEKIGARIEKAKKEMTPIIEKKEKEIIKKYDILLGALYIREQNLYTEIKNFTKKRDLVEEQKELDKMANINGWWDSPYM